MMFISRGINTWGIINVAKNYVIIIKILVHILTI
jgi:hypothetical protein